MHAVILAGGKGTRLRPYTTVLPKPLMPLGEMPILEVVLRQLKHAGFTRATLAVSYLSEIIQAFCGDGSKFGLDIQYSHETKALSTAGPLKLIPDLDDTFLVMNGDVLTTLDYGKLVAYHKAQGAAATAAIFPREVKVDFGVVNTHDDGTLNEYIEKPTYNFRVSMGINVLDPSALNFIKDDEALGMPDLLLRLKEDGKKVCTYEQDCLWLDIGREDDYKTAMETFEDNRSDFLGD